MCLITISYKQYPAYPLIIIQNRDESYTRESQPIHIWKDIPDILAGRDKLHGGTWAGITKSGRVASLTNRLFEALSAGEPSLSRGKLVKDFLEGHHSPDIFLQYLRVNRFNYESYQLVFGTIDDLHVYSNATDQHRVLQPGLHSLSSTNDDLSSHKVNRSLHLVGEYLKGHPEPNLDDLLTLYNDKRQANSLKRIPENLSMDLALEHSSIFIEGDVFGTVNTTALSIHKDKTVKMKEYRYDRKALIETTEKQFKLK
ncbi:NRDE family protein [Alkalibacterium sp. f15]|uniref:NRDE family protein n=1 Tax=Alkalibacterium sp. f15 TaxID=3414029 RepID=UPI003BF85EAE